MLGRLFLTSRKDRRKDGVFLWDAEELTFLIIYRWSNQNKSSPTTTQNSQCAFFNFEENHLF